MFSLKTCSNFTDVHLSMNLQIAFRHFMISRQLLIYAHMCIQNCSYFNDGVVKGGS